MYLNELLLVMRYLRHYVIPAAAASGGGWDGGHGGGDAQRVAEPPAAGPRRGGAAHAQLQRAVRPLRPPQQHAVVSHPQGGDATQGHSLY